MGQDNEASVEGILESIQESDRARQSRPARWRPRRRRENASDQAAAEAPAREATETRRQHHVRDEDEVLDLSDMEFTPDGETAALPLAKLAGDRR